MRMTRSAIPAILATLLYAAAAHAGERKDIRYLDLVNRAHDSITSLEIAPAGSGAFRQQQLEAPLRGGGDSATIGIVAEGCLNDFRFKFRNGRTLVYQNLDLCNGGKLSVRPLPRRDASPQARYADGRAR